MLQKLELGVYRRGDGLCRGLGRGGWGAVVSALEVTGWIPCTTPPVRDGDYDLTADACIGTIAPIRMAFSDGIWKREDGKTFLMGPELGDWSWRGVRRWVLQASGPTHLPVQSRLCLVKANPSTARWGSLLNARTFADKGAAARYAAKYPRLALTAVLP